MFQTEIDQKTGGGVQRRQLLPVIGILSLFLAVFSPAHAPAQEKPPVASTFSGNYLAARFASNNNNLSAASFYLSHAIVRMEHADTGLLGKDLRLTLAQGNLDEARSAAEAILLDEPSSAIANLLTGVDALRTGDIERAKTTFRKMETYGNFAIMQPLILAWIEADTGNLAAAMKTITLLEHEFADARITHLLDYHRALLKDYTATRAGTPDEQIEKFYLSAMLNSEVPNYRIVQAMGNYLERRGEPEKAVQHYTRYLKEMHDSILVDDFKARRDGDYQPPAPLIRSLKDGVAEALLSTAELTGRHNVEADVYGVLQLALALRPDFPMAHFRLGRAHESSGAAELALASYRRIPEDSPLYYLGQIRTAITLVGQDNNKRAIRTLEELAEAYPHRYDIWLHLGWIYRTESAFGEAIPMYDEALKRVTKLEPHHWPIFYYRGVSYEREKQWEKAEPDFLQALELKPDQPDVLNYLGYSWLVIDRNLKQAKELIEGAVMARPNDPHIIDSIGWAHYKLQDYETAASYLERAIEMMPYDPTINDHLGDVYWAMGRRNEARFQWQRALLNDPDDELRVSLQEKLRNGLPPSSGVVESQRTDAVE